MNTSLDQAVIEFQRFLAADNLESILDSFAKLEQNIEINHCQDDFNENLRALLSPLLPYTHTRIFSVLEQVVNSRKKLKSEQNSSQSVLISGAGPCGLRAAIEARLIGMKVIVIEKRKAFSRANIITLWSETCSDLIALGAKFFFPEMQIQGNLKFMGTREIQLFLLKIALLLGVEVQYGHSIDSIRFDEKIQTWKASVKKYCPEVRSSSKEERALDFKASKMHNYKPTFRCNMVENAVVDHSFIDKGECDQQYNVKFTSLFIAEGEHSTLIKKLGFKKTVDKFAKAIGVVLNLCYDKENPIEKKLKSFLVNRFTPNWQDGPLGVLESLGYRCENMEYLKGTTHYAVVTIDKASLLKSGALISDNVDLLTPENINIEALFKMGRVISETCGIPESANYFEHNPVQIFDFSTRSRCVHPMKLLAPEYPYVFEDAKERFDSTKSALVFPIGDALLEPFWPEGLGTNRGFHGLFDSIHALHLLSTTGSLSESFKDRNFFYSVMHGFAFTRAIIQPFQSWSIIPQSRYSSKSIKSIHQSFKKTDGLSRIPERISQE